MSLICEKLISGEKQFERFSLNSKNLREGEIKIELDDLSKNEPSDVWVVKAEEFEDYESSQDSLGEWKHFSNSSTILVCPVNSRKGGSDKHFHRINLIQKGKQRDLGNVLLPSQQKENRFSPTEYYISNVGIPTAAESPNLTTDNSDGDHSNSSSCESINGPSSSSSDDPDKKCYRKSRVKLSVLDESLRYRHIRELNNLASKRLRERKKREKEELYNQLSQLERDNFKLKKQMESLEMAKDLLRSLLLGR